MHRGKSSRLIVIWGATAGIFLGMQAGYAGVDQGGRVTSASPAFAGVKAVATPGVATWGADTDAPTTDQTLPTEFTKARQNIPGTSESAALAKATAWVDRAIVAGAQVSHPNAKGDIGVFLDFDVQSDHFDNGGALAGLWQADLVQGVFEELLAGGKDNLSGAVDGVNIVYRDADGEKLEFPGGAGDIAPGQRFGDSATTDAQLEQRLRSASEGFGLNVVSIRIFHPFDAAAAIVVRLPTRDALDGRLDALREALLGEPKTLEGLYLEVQAPDGSILAINSVAFRSGAGRVWISPDYDQRSGIAHSHYPMGG